MSSKSLFWLAVFARPLSWASLVPDPRNVFNLRKAVGNVGKSCELLCGLLDSYAVVLESSELGRPVYFDREMVGVTSDKLVENTVHAYSLIEITRSCITMI